MRKNTNFHLKTLQKFDKQANLKTKETIKNFINCDADSPYKKLRMFLYFTLVIKF